MYHNEMINEDEDNISVISVSSTVDTLSYSFEKPLIVPTQMQRDLLIEKEIE